MMAVTIIPRRDVGDHTQLLPPERFSPDLVDEDCYYDAFDGHPAPAARPAKPGAEHRDGHQVRRVGQVPDKRGPARSLPRRGALGPLAPDGPHVLLIALDPATLDATPNRGSRSVPGRGVSHPASAAETPNCVGWSLHAQMGFAASPSRAVSRTPGSSRYPAPRSDGADSATASPTTKRSGRWPRFSRVTVAVPAAMLASAAPTSQT